MSGKGLIQALRAFDDTALTTLASKGLLRRAQRDLDSGNVALLEVLDDGARVRADGEEVRIGPEGPAAAVCTCRAPGICRHRLAAVLVLRHDAEPPAHHAAEEPVAGGVDTAHADAGPPPDMVGDPLAEILALSSAAIAKWAGKATLRAAEEMLEESQNPAIRVDGASIAVRLNPSVPEVRFLTGQGLSGMISKVPRAKRKAIHAAVIVAVRRRHGASEPTTDPESPERGTPTEAAAVDPGFLVEVRGCLTDCVRTGFSQAPLVLEERLFALSVSSRADSLPRLSAILRTIAARVREKREHDFSLDLEAYLALVAEAYALAQALRTEPEASENTTRLGALKGQIRQDYRPAGRLTLYGMGARRWRTAAGARGVTGYFYAPDQDRWYSAGIVRAHGHDTAFSPRRAYERESLWGAGALSKLCRAKIVMDRAAAASDGRLSLSKEIAATASPWSSRRENLNDWPLAFNNWRRLEAELHDCFSPGLSRPRRGPQPVILIPAAAAQPNFDELAQETIWPLRDEQGIWLGLTLRHGDDSRAVAEDFERILRSERPWAVAVLATPGRRSFELEPFALFLQAGEVGCHNIGLDPIENAGVQRPLSLLRRLGREAATVAGLGQGSLSWAGPAGATERSLTDATDALLGVAEMGSIIDTEGRDQIKALGNRFESRGLTPLAMALTRLASADRQSLPARLLESAYLVSCVQALLRPLPTLSE